MSADSSIRRLPAPALAALGSVTLLALAFVWWIAATLAELPPLPGRPFARPLTGYVSIVADLIGRLAAIATLGGLLAIVAFRPRADDDADPAPQALTRWSGRAAQLWFWSALLQSAANAAYVNGVPIGTAFNPVAWWYFLQASPSALAWFCCALVAAATAAACYLPPRIGGFAVLLGAGTLALTFVAVTGNVTVGLNHDWATDSAVAVALALIILASAAVAVVLTGTTGDDPDVAARLRRYQGIVLPAVGFAAAGHLVIAWQQLAGESPFGVLYGLPTLGFFGILGLLTLSWIARRLLGGPGMQREPSRAVATVVADLALLIGYAALLAAANHIPTPRFLVPQNAQINYLGYEMDVPATAELIVGPGRPNLLWILLAALAIGSYLVGVVRAYRSGTRWPPGRILAWVGGWGLVLFIATSGLWSYSTAVFSWHMLVHMTVNMLVPVLWVLGAPLTLWRSVTRDGVLANAVGVIDRINAYPPLSRLLSPPVLWVNYVGSLFLVYFTPLFPWLMRYHWAHQLMLLYFMVTGYTFFSLIIGSDRQPWNLPHIIKLALTISIMPFHAMFAVGIMSARGLIGEDFYRAIDVRWVTDLLADQNIAGQITWMTGEVPLLIVIIALAAQWFWSDRAERTQLDSGFDSGADDSFDAYNDMLKELAARDRVADATDRNDRARRP